MHYIQKIYSDLCWLSLLSRLKNIFYYFLSIKMATQRRGRGLCALDILYEGHDFCLSFSFKTYLSSNDIFDHYVYGTVYLYLHVVKQSIQFIPKIQ
ncbi:hypothetical protein XELAEV_18042738mg [Xenopus laevis]|uniref:Uncharacterized protein n=1 Tax=Xenopus laevis TaxID=8355 RepID=A0A974C4P6_XENLA|nr:hypothetical protein XELAEV_18042738mg [Xenopus laevis]